MPVPPPQLPARPLGVWNSVADAASGAALNQSDASSVRGFKSIRLSGTFGAAGLSASGSDRARQEIRTALFDIDARLQQVVSQNNLSSRPSDEHSPTPAPQAADGREASTPPSGSLAAAASQRASQSPELELELRRLVEEKQKLVKMLEELDSDSSPRENSSHSEGDMDIEQEADESRANDASAGARNSHSRTHAHQTAPAQSKLCAQDMVERVSDEELLPSALFRNARRRSSANSVPDEFAQKPSQREKGGSRRYRKRRLPEAFADADTEEDHSARRRRRRVNEEREEGEATESESSGGGRCSGSSDLSSKGHRSDDDTDDRGTGRQQSRLPGRPRSRTNGHSNAADSPLDHRSNGSHSTSPSSQSYSDAISCSAPLSQSQAQSQAEGVASSVDLPKHVGSDAPLYSGTLEGSLEQPSVLTPPLTKPSSALTIPFAFPEAVPQTPISIALPTTPARAVPEASALALSTHSGAAPVPTLTPPSISNSPPMPLAASGAAAPYNLSFLASGSASAQSGEFFGASFSGLDASRDSSHHTQSYLPAFDHLCNNGGERLDAERRSSHASLDDLSAATSFGSQQTNQYMAQLIQYLMSNQLQAQAQTQRSAEHVGSAVQSELLKRSFSLPDSKLAHLYAERLSAASLAPAEWLAAAVAGNEYMHALGAGAALTPNGLSLLSPVPTPPPPPFAGSRAAALSDPSAGGAQYLNGDDSDLRPFHNGFLSASADYSAPYFDSAAACDASSLPPPNSHASSLSAATDSLATSAASATAPAYASTVDFISSFLKSDRTLEVCS